MVLKNVSMDKESIETIDPFIPDVIGYITKKSEEKLDQPTVIDYLFNKINKINAKKHVFKKIITLLTINVRCKTNQMAIKVLIELKNSQK